jgi:outer membrane protein TolC
VVWALRRNSCARLLRVIPAAAILTCTTPLWAGEPPTTEAAHGDVIAMSLDAAVARALSASFRVGRADRNRQIADLREQNVRTGRLPRLSVGVGVNQAARGTYQATPTYTLEEGLTGDFRTGVNIAAQMPIDISGALRRQTEQARRLSRIAELDSDQARIDVSFEVRAAYVAALRSLGAARVDQEAAEAIARLARGAGSEAAQFLQVELSAARQAMQASRAAAEMAEDSLRQWLRLPPSATLMLTTPLEALARTIAGAAVADAALHDRPDLRQAKLRVANAENAVKQATDGRKPSMTLNAYYNHAWNGESAIRPDDSRTRDQGGVLALNVPLYTWDWGQGRNAKRIARIQEEQAEADLLEQQERAANELRQALAALGRADSRIKALPREEQASAALRQAEGAFLDADANERRVLLPQVSNARAAWREARLSALGAYADKAVAELRVERATGAGAAD